LPLHIASCLRRWTRGQSSNPEGNGSCYHLFVVRSPKRDTIRNRWLWHAFARSVRASVMAEFVVQALRIGGIVVLARALSPHDFGLFKILVVVATFAL
jgi:hypothetical protein